MNQTQFQKHATGNNNISRKPIAEVKQSIARAGNLMTFLARITLVLYTASTRMGGVISINPQIHSPPSWVTLKQNRMTTYVVDVMSRVRSGNWRCLPCLLELPENTFQWKDT